MALIKPLETTALYQRCDPMQFTFATTTDLQDLTEVIGQERAVEAVRFGIGIRREGFNLFALGPEGTGKYTVVRHYLERQAATQSPPSDWCYVHNFMESHKPNALRLPPGGGPQLRREMERLVEELRTAIPATFESEHYRRRRQEIEEEFRERQEKAAGRGPAPGSGTWSRPDAHTDGAGLCADARRSGDQPGGFPETPP